MLPEENPGARDRIEFGSRLRAARKERGYPPSVVAEIAMIDEETLRRYEAGERSPQLEVAQRLAAAVGVTLDHLLADDYLERLRPPESVLEWFGRRASFPASVSAQHDPAGDEGRSSRRSSTSSSDLNAPAAGAGRKKAADQRRRKSARKSREGGI